MGWSGTLTHRQFIMWHYWLEEQYNQPSRSEYYLMNVAAEIRRGNVKNPRNVNTEDFKLEFKQKNRKKTEQEIKSQTDLTIARWINHMTLPVTVKDETGKEVNTILPASVRRQELEKQRLEKMNKERQNGNNNRTGRISSKVDSGRKQLPQNSRRSKSQN